MNWFPGDSLGVNNIPSGSLFTRFIHKNKQVGNLVVQPRMGFGPLQDMQRGLASVKALGLNCVGTITLDSYTRVGDVEGAIQCLRERKPLNGFPILAHSLVDVEQLLASVRDESFPIQIRHGTPEPQNIFRRMTELGLDTTEGGPVSYCLPYSRVPLSRAVSAWDEACNILVHGVEYAHIETFGGCLLGQLCPPSLLIAISVLECMYFIQRGIPSVSLSFAQGTSFSQDLAALKVLRDIANKKLAGSDWHVTLYTYMGVYPATSSGALALLVDSAVLAKNSGCERIIVKTKVESMHVPSIEDNLEALTIAHRSSVGVNPLTLSAQEQQYYEEIFDEAMVLINTTLNLASDVGKALVIAFKRGVLDIPFCLHKNNLGKSATYIDEKNALKWASVGNMPIATCPSINSMPPKKVTSNMLLEMLYRNAQLYDEKSAV